MIAGNVGYRNTIFNHLPETAIGDEIVLSVVASQPRYRVTKLETVQPSDSWVMAPTHNEMLTLISCVPIGVYSHRLIVRAAPAEPWGPGVIEEIETYLRQPDKVNRYEGETTICHSNSGQPLPPG